MVCTTAALLATLGMHLALSEVCSLSNPDTITTWASRRADPRYCDAGQFCHAYVMAGQRSSRVRLVGHIVTDELISPFRAEAVICEVGVLNASLCIGPSWVVPGSLLDLRAPEDPRFVMHILLTNLTGERYYSAEMRFVHGVPGGVSYSTKVISWMALPDETSNTPVRFLAGGDVYQGRPFTQLLMVAMVAEPDPHFILLGGDLAYANSMRTCYLRWDQFLRDLSAIRTAKGFSLPIITIVGNHEAGGYMVQKSRSSYNFYVQYLPQYDDDIPTDSTITYHSHYIGKLLGLICLDSSIMIPATEQVPYLTNTLLSMSNPTVPALSKFVIVLQHNPMFPSSRDFSDDTSADIRTQWMPLYDSNKVPLVLEFHDHAYKRTWPMFQGAVRVTDGTTYLGDGALGVYAPDRTPDPSRNYLQKTLPLNYILLMKLYPNGTLFSEAWSADNAKIDSFSLDRR